MSDVEQRRQPQRGVEADAAEVLAEDDAGLADGRGEERLERARAALLGDEAHGDDGGEEHDEEPEEDGAAEEVLQDGAVLHRALR